MNSSRHASYMIPFSLAEWNQGSISATWSLHSEPWVVVCIQKHGCILTDEYGNVRGGGQPGIELTHGSSTIMRTYWQPEDNWVISDHAISDSSPVTRRNGEEFVCSFHSPGCQMSGVLTCSACVLCCLGLLKQVHRYRVLTFPPVFVHFECSLCFCSCGRDPGVLSLACVKRFQWFINLLVFSLMIVVVLDVMLSCLLALSLPSFLIFAGSDRLRASGGPEDGL